MLARGNRLTDGADYRAVVRRGARCSGAHTVTYSVSDDGDVTRFGFIVSKHVGTAVVRNTVRRRLKAICAEALPTIASGSQVVIRALPRAATTPYPQLRAEVSRCLQRVAA